MKNWLRSNFDGATVSNLRAMALPWAILGVIIGLISVLMCPMLMAMTFCFGLVFITADRYFEIKDKKNGNRQF